MGTGLPLQSEALHGVKRYARVSGKLFYYDYEANGLANNKANATTRP
jgi:hypothetical protein